MKKTVIRLTESDLHRIVCDSVYQILEQRQDINEGWKNWAMAGALGAATMFGNPQAANAQKHQYQENPYINGVEQVNHQYSRNYDITYDNEDSSSLIYDLLRNNAQYKNNMTQDVVSKIQSYPKYKKNTPIENFLKANQNLINKCGGKVGGIDSDVTFVYHNGSFYLVPSEIRKL